MFERTVEGESDRKLLGAVNRFRDHFFGEGGSSPGPSSGGAGPVTVREVLTVRFLSGGKRVRGGYVGERGFSFWGGVNEQAPSQPNVKVLVIISAADRIPLKQLYPHHPNFLTGGPKEHPTGYFLGELTFPLEALDKAGYTFVFATPGGKRPTIDRDSLLLQYWYGNGRSGAGMKRIVTATRTAKRARSAALRLVGSKYGTAINAPRSLASLKAAELDGFTAVLVPGGHAPMADLWNNPEVGRILGSFHDAGKPTALICHAPIALLAVSRQPWPYAGYRVSCVSNSEERFAEKRYTRGTVEFYPADALGKRGAIIEAAELDAVSLADPRLLKLYREAKFTVDRELITAQNPLPGRFFGDAIVKAIETYRKSGDLRR